MKKFLLLLAFLFLFASCSDSDEDTSEKFSVYYFKDQENSALTSVSLNLSGDSVTENVQTALDLLYSPEESDSISVFPSDLRHTDFKISDSTCTITFPTRYSSLATKARVAIDTALVKTLCSLNQIRTVVISCDGIDKSYSNDNFVLSSPKIYYSTQTVNLYFANKDFSNLRKTTKNISVQSSKSLEYTVISSLFHAPVSPNYRSPFPSNTSLNNVYISNQVCYIDLSPEFVENAIHTEEAEAVIIRAIVNTATELPSVNSVKFLINGNDAYGFSYFDISKPLTDKFDSGK